MATSPDRRSSFSIITKGYESPDRQETPPALVPYVKKPTAYSPAYSCVCRKKNILQVFRKLQGLKDYQQDILHIRYFPLYQEYQRRSLFYAIVFHFSRFIVTVGSITVPALLSIKFSGISYEWITWSISLAVTIFNGILTLFKIDKKYYFLHTTKSLLESEGWQYASLGGKYAKAHEEGATNSHEHQFMYFALAVEKIKMRQVEEEYYKAQDSVGSPAAPAPKGPTASNSSNMNEFYSSSLLRSSGASPTQQTDEMKQWVAQIVEETARAKAQNQNLNTASTSY